MRFPLYSLAVFVCACAAQAQTTAPAGRAIGEVVSVDAAGSELLLRGDKGESVKVALGEKTLFLRVPPGETNLQKAARIKLNEIAAGDRVLARGQVSADGKVTAAAVIVMTRAELAQKHERDRAAWQAGGTAGKVTAVDAAAHKLTLAGRMPGAPPVIVEWTGQTQFRRYAPDSVRFSDAKPGAPTDLQPGDQARVLGAREGDVIRAEQIVSGAFRQAAGTIAAIDAQAREIRLNDLATKKPIVIRLNADTAFKKIPPEMAAMMARRLNATAPAGQGAPREGAGRMGPPPGGGGRMPDLQTMMERWPAFTLADLKPGDALIVSSAAGADAGRLTAITLIAGVEPLLTAAPDRAASFGGWNFGEIGLPQ
jgi:hypothetical protein